MSWCRCLCRNEYKTTITGACGHESRWSEQINIGLGDSPETILIVLAFRHINAVSEKNNARCQPPVAPPTPIGNSHSEKNGGHHKVQNNVRNDGVDHPFSSASDGGLPSHLFLDESTFRACHRIVTIREHLLQFSIRSCGCGLLRLAIHQSKGRLFSASSDADEFVEILTATFFTDDATDASTRARCLVISPVIKQQSIGSLQPSRFCFTISLQPNFYVSIAFVELGEERRVEAQPTSPHFAGSLLTSRT